MKLSKAERKMVESIVRSEVGYRYCRVCGKPVMHMNGQPQEQSEWERKNEMHWTCYQYKQAEKRMEAERNA